MLPDTQNIQSGISLPEKISILLVSAHSDDFIHLRDILHRDWLITHCGSAKEAGAHLASDKYSIVICERDLCDGNWRDILEKGEKIANCPLLLVMSRHADERLWAEVLNLGGYDVLLKPFDHSEVTRVIGMAWRYWFNSLRRAVAPIRVAPRFA